MFHRDWHVFGMAMQNSYFGSHTVGTRKWTHHVTRGQRTESQRSMCSVLTGSWFRDAACDEPHSSLVHVFYWSHFSEVKGRGPVRAQTRPHAYLEGGVADSTPAHHAWCSSEVYCEALWLSHHSGTLAYVQNNVCPRRVLWEMIHRLCKNISNGTKCCQKTGSLDTAISYFVMTKSIEWKTSHIILTPENLLWIHPFYRWGNWSP